MATDQQLLGIFSNMIHLTDGTHLDGEISVNEDAKWQQLYNCIASCSLPLYDLPNGQWAHCFLLMLTDLWVRVIQRHGAVVGIPIFHPLSRPWDTRFHDVKPVVWGWLDAWDVGRYVTLMKEVKEVKLDSGGGGRRVEVQCQDDATSLDVVWRQGPCGHSDGDQQRHRGSLLSKQSELQFWTAGH